MAETTQRSRVLLVDDEAALAQSYSRLLPQDLYEVTTATDAQIALELLRLRQFDVVISDVWMPRMGGVQFLRAIRERDTDLPVILISAHPDLETAMEAVEHMAFRFLAKPVDGANLRQVVQRAAQLHRLAVLKREALAVAAPVTDLGDGATLELRFQRAINTLWMAYQPIVRWPAAEVFAYEALVRNDEPTLLRPDHFFDAGERLGRVHEIGQAIRKRVANDLANNPQVGTVFINVHPVDLTDESLYSPEAPLSSLARRIVLELTERSPLEGVGALDSRLDRLNALGYRLAVDDLGAGYAGLRSITALEPDFVKLDMSLIRDIDRSSKKQSVVRSMISLCQAELGMQVVAEGVETEAERDVLSRMGAELLQGYHFARPGPNFPAAKL